VAAPKSATVFSTPDTAIQRQLFFFSSPRSSGGNLTILTDGLLARVAPQLLFEDLSGKKGKAFPLAYRGQKVIVSVTEDMT